uniref:ATP synthase F1 complex delta/epsilon subunit N-terminal domain-containing protein n=1 Tax=Grammatophora oceanica TaxID=210454 RepID=A0A7S1UY04_9STRA|mmetsp:Transcript_29144/g.42927  ORF Transcript_29144/g.42927 Transcript_29144/m.42927 type:complete len:166 (+) Transcript_29144:95-592(+)|eukprot:CAMPEP_0194035226 /NCGR_PEP_ID=MMETSP0009_2-20130614/7673_1 /TAXON_ID=210454 /ORGANISM="Grammatophora oceanica, Strain CCMP 410" /LENGTH=165 /DNA_ID=CAMNT_0038676497 /DNA_START=83 /DNA_END=580 /DNA_ORIENTATION=+
MLSRTASSLVRRATARAFSSEAAAPASGKMTLNFSLPDETVYAGAEVDQVIVPGEAGEYGITANHVPIVSELKAGVLQILHGDGEPEKYFVSGGFALTHDDSSTDISCPVAVKLDDLDSSAVSSNYDAAKSAFASAEAGSIAQAEAQIEMDVNKSMGSALGLNLS